MNCFSLRASRGAQGHSGAPTPTHSPTGPAFRLPFISCHRLNPDREKGFKKPDDVLEMKGRKESLLLACPSTCTRVCDLSLPSLQFWEVGLAYVITPGRQGPC